ncbi:MAG TPA: DUF4388 domain-containing protein [Pyrinomonadaceae bacterium]|nr:DUF4388 domain-containing protein [Pyrinomonadaceae bacterium]
MSDILNLIHQITANRDSGRLEILAGAIQGELSFADGKLIDARLGHLTGFRAVNAVAAMRDARFSFDPAFAPLASSSITASERVVLKQFFGIEAAAPSEYLEPVMDWPPAEAAPAVTVPDEVEEVTIVKSNVPGPGIPTPPPHAARFSYRTALVFAVLAMAVMATAAILIDRFHTPGSSAVVASVESPSRPAPAQQAEPPVAHSTSAPAPVKEGKKTVNPVRNLSGKWTIVNSVDTTGYRSFKNMKIGFDLSINQTGSTFTGSGRKVSENGRTLPADSRTPIQVKGSINGDRIEATFFEEGTARKSNGKFVWRLDKSGRGLTGNFATTAARSRGKSAATRSL